MALRGSGAEAGESRLPSGRSGRNFRAAGMGTQPSRAAPPHFRAREEGFAPRERRRAGKKEGRFPYKAGVFDKGARVENWLYPRRGSILRPAADSTPSARVEIFSRFGSGVVRGLKRRTLPKNRGEARGMDAPGGAVAWLPFVNPLLHRPRRANAKEQGSCNFRERDCFFSCLWNHSFSRKPPSNQLSEG